MKPVLLAPAFKDYLWGGTRLKNQFGKKSDLDIVAESWELSTHKDGQSIIASGEDKGLTLSEYIEKHGEAILGSRTKDFEYFPILIKLIDAKQSLSIQVHPSDEYALKNEGEYGKTEMWYIVDADPGSSLYYGLNQTITKDEFRKRIEDNTILEVLNKVEVHKGDVFFINSGTIHAIGEGILICEIQQNSNTTYRVYDYDRRDAQGNPRELHIEKAIDVSDLFPVPEREDLGGTQKFDGYTKETLAKCRYFSVDKLDITTAADLEVTDESFRSVVITEGEGVLIVGDDEVPFKLGDSIFIPAQNRVCTIKGSCVAIISYV